MASVHSFTSRSEAATGRALVSGAAGCNVCTARADVAQLVEQRFRKPQVTGSNPVVGSRLRSQERGERNCRRSLGEGGLFDRRQFLSRATAWQFSIADFDD